MIKQLFSLMHDMLDEMTTHYPAADAALRGEIKAQMHKLQAMSDEIVDGWLLIEEKLAQLRETAAACEAAAGAVKAAAGAALQVPAVPADAAAAGQAMESDRFMAAGQGYYDLEMYQEAAASFAKAVHRHPDSVSARMYLAMSHMHLRQWEDAERHFLFIAGVASEPKIRALSLNALGCIQAVRSNLQQAARYFQQACEADPTFLGAARNLSNCRSNAGQLTLDFGSADLGCM